MRFDFNYQPDGERKTREGDQDGRETMMREAAEGGDTSRRSIRTMIEVHSMGNTVPEQIRGVQKRRHTDRQSFRKLQRLVQSPEVQKMSREDRGGLQKLRDWKKPLLTLQIPSMRCLWTRRSKLPCSCQKVGLRLVSQH